MLAFLCAHTAVWTLYALLSHRGTIHDDMLEAYYWGREFQLGYYKHPPFWAWIAGGWFEVFPRTNWAFYLLSSLNSGIAILGAWQLLGLLTKGEDRFNATALLLLSLAYTLQGHQYNANFILTSLWPWTAYFFLLSMEKRTASSAILFGALAAACMLSKYYSIFLLLSCATASFYHPGWRRYYASWAPYLTIGCFVVLMLPHVWWLTANDFPTFTYAESKADFPDGKVETSFFTFIFGCMALNLAAALLIAFCRPRDTDRPARAPLARHYEAFVGILGLGPFVFTLLSAITGHFRISTNFASPIFYLMPLILMQLLRPSPTLLRQRVVVAARLFYVGALCIAPAVPSLMAALGDRKPTRAIEIAHEARRIWWEATHRPLRIVGGSSPYAAATVFYGGDPTSAFPGFDQKHSPWVTDAAIARDGLLALCRADDSFCLMRAAQIKGARQEFQLSAPNRGGAVVDFRLIVFPPHDGRVGDIPQNR